MHTIYYADESHATVSTHDESIRVLPKRGVALVKTNGKILRPADYYMWRPSLQMFTEHTDAASVVIAASKEQWITLFLGEYIPDERFKDILHLAQS